MSLPQDLGQQAEVLVAKIKHYLITTMGRVSDEASIDEFYRALCFALREEIMINWLAVARSQQAADVRMVYYLSMEYLPGRLLASNVTNLAIHPLIGLVLQKMNRGFAEILNRDVEPGLGNGGLGRLASCLLDSAATMQYPVQAYGLRYQYGTFEQQIWEGVQVEAPDCWLLNENPWEFRRDARKILVKYCGETSPSTNIHGDEILLLKGYEEVSALPYDIPIIGYNLGDNRFSVVTLRLWSTKESPRNFQLQRYNAGSVGQAAENTTLSDVLYPSDYHETGKRIRLKQEFLLVSASIQDIIRHYLATHENFRAFSDKVRIQINDTHASLVIPELIRILTKDHDLPWKMAFEITQACTGYTNHTVLQEALEEWEQPLFHYLLPRQYQIIQRMNQDFCTAIRKQFPNQEDKVRSMSILENGKVRMAHLAIVGSHSVNGVAALHTEILKKSVFKDFYAMMPEKFLNVTNGVTQRRWLLNCNPDLAKFITKRIGEGWITDFGQIHNLASFASDPASQEEFLTIKRKNKFRLLEYLDHEKLRNAQGQPTIPYPNLEPNSLFDVQIKRIHEYKRQLMNILHLIMLYQEMLASPHHERIKRTAIFAGKAAAGYETAKDIIRLICAVARKVNSTTELQGALKIIFIENYNVSKAELIIPAADLSEQISTAGTEASGTGNMKLTMNGALTIGTSDGANIEMQQKITNNWWPFTFGCSSEEITALRASHTYDPKALMISHPQIGRAVNSLIDHTFASNEQEHAVFSGLYRQLTEPQYGTTPDRFFLLKDLVSYAATQKEVELLFQKPNKWAEYVLQNIAGMGAFTTDCSMKNYCGEKIWGIPPFPANKEILERIRHEYSLMDSCRIY
jgi:starch phosphorylase